MRIPFDQMKSEFSRVLLLHGYSSIKADLSAELFTQSTCDGVPSHGLNKFPQLIDYLKKGWVRPDVAPVLVRDSGVFAQYDGQQGPGDCNAHFAMKVAIEKAKERGLGLVALRNTNHWMRPGNYGWQAVAAGVIAICWSNTAPNMVAWGSKARILGNNPLVIAIPHEEHPVVLDMAMSQYSYGKMEIYRRAGKQMPSASGFDQDWKLTTDPAKVLEEGRVLPAGFWKGSGLSLVLDLLAAILSDGLSTHEIGHGNWETNLSQVFLAIDPEIALLPTDMTTRMTNTLSELMSSESTEDAVRYPGLSVLQTREENLRLGIPVDPEIWDHVVNYRT